MDIEKMYLIGNLVYEIFYGMFIIVFMMFSNSVWYMLIFV